jgi:hypothetical protein
MRQVGHADPKVTLSIYAQVMFRGEGERERLKALVEGADWALMGTEGTSKLPEPGEQLSLETIEFPALAGDSRSGRSWTRTRDLFLIRNTRIRLDLDAWGRPCRDARSWPQSLARCGSDSVCLGFHPASAASVRPASPSGRSAVARALGCIVISPDGSR